MPPIAGLEYLESHTFAPETRFCMSKQPKRSEVKFIIETGDKHVPEKIQWQASDGQTSELKDTKSIIISIWDHKEKETLRIDLWTNDMPIDEMQRHFQETLITLSESFQRATGNPIVVKEMVEFCKNLADKTNELTRQSQ